MRPSTKSAALVASTFILAHYFVPRWDSCAWGLDTLVGLSNPVRLTVIAAGLAAVLLLAWLLPRLDVDVDNPWPTRSVALVASALALFGFLAFSTWPSATALLGDGQLRMRDLDATRVHSFDFRDWALNGFSAPLSIWIYAKLHAWGPDRSALVTTTGIAFVCGVAYVILSVLLATRSGRTWGERVVLGAFLLGSGSMQIFFGYAENYAFLFPMLLVYGLAGERDARRRDVPWRSALVLSVLVALHFFTISLLPSLVVLGLRSRRPRPSVVISVGLTLTVAGLWLAAIRFPLFASLRESEISKTLPWLGDPDRSQAYRMLDLAHGRDLLNLALLVAPAPLLALGFWRRRRRDTLDVFFAAVALFPLLAVCLANPTIGAFRDWDVLSWGLLPLGWIVARHTHTASALIFAAAGLWHTSTWVALNADMPRSEQRFERLLDRCPISRRGGAYGWEDVARRHADAGRFGEAALATLRATDATPGNPRLWLNAGELMRVSGNAERARECFERSRKLRPDWAEPSHHLGILFVETNRWEDAIAELRHTLELDPSLANAWYELGLAHARNGEPDSARVAFLRFLEDRPNSAVTHWQLGELALAAGDSAAARVDFERALALDPNGEVGARASARLGGVFR